MTLVAADRVRELSSTTGTGSFALGGAPTGFRTFSSAIGTGNTCYYLIANRDVQSEWEVGFGTLSASTTLARTEVIASSNAGSAVNFSAGTKDVVVIKPAETDMLVDPGIAQGRLTLVSGTPVTSTDQTNRGTIYYAPYVGNRIALYTGNRWVYRTFSEFNAGLNTLTTNFPTQTANNTNGSAVITNIASTASYHVGCPVTGAGVPNPAYIISVDSGTQITISANCTSTNTGFNLTVQYANYDIFVYDVAGTATLYATKWTNNATRLSLLTRQDGILVLFGDATKRYIGTLRLTGIDSTEDSLIKRYLRNQYNAVARRLFACPAYSDNNANTTWTTTSTTLARANGGTGNRVEYICGPDDGPALHAHFVGNAPASGYFIGGISVDSTTTAKAACQVGNPSHSGSCCVMDQPAEGWHYSELLVLTNTGTATFSADFANLGGSSDPRTTYLEGWMRG